MVTRLGPSPLFRVNSHSFITSGPKDRLVGLLSRKIRVFCCQICGARARLVKRIVDVKEKMFPGQSDAYLSRGGKGHGASPIRFSTMR